MLTCKQVAKALDRQHYDRMTPWHKFTLRFHIAICFVCGTFHRDLIQMQQGVDELKRREESESPAEGECLKPESRCRLQAAIEAEKAALSQTDNH